MTTLAGCLLVGLALAAVSEARKAWRDRRIRRAAERDHLRLLWASMRDRGYDVLPLDVTLKTGLILAETEWNRIHFQLEEALQEGAHHGH